MKIDGLIEYFVSQYEHRGLDTPPPLTAFQKSLLAAVLLSGLTFKASRSLFRWYVLGYVRVPGSGDKVYRKRCCRERTGCST